VIGQSATRLNSVRRLAARAVVVLGAVFVGGQLMRALPHEQTLIFPVGSEFPNATHFAASWKQLGDAEPRGGVSLTFTRTPPLQIRQRAKLPDGDYIVSIDIQQARESKKGAPDVPAAPEAPENALQAGETAGSREGLQTNIERRVSLSGGEALIALAVVPREPSVSE